MQTITKTYKVYNFDELSEEAQDYAIEKLWDINTEYDWWQDDYLLELTKKEMTDCKIKLSDNWHKISPDKNIPGEYPEHSGLFKWKEIYFSIDREWYIQFKDLKVTDENIFRKFLKIPKKLWQNCYWYFDEEPYRETTTKFIIESDKINQKDFTDNENAIIENAINRMNSKIEEALYILKEEYEYLTSRESIIETIKANEYTFLETGELFS